MKYQPVEIKLLAHIDTTSFDEDLWQFEFDDDISTLLLIDYALEQFQQKVYKLKMTMLSLNTYLSN